MTKPQGDTDIDYLTDDNKDRKIIKEIIRSQIEKSYQQGVEDMRRKCVEALIIHAEPYEGAKWLNNMSADTITKVINSIKCQKESIEEQKR